MTARTPEDLDRLFAESLNAGKLDALVAQSGDLPVVSWLFAIDLPFGVEAGAKP